ncbi:hypothetical protein BDW69DRAFT_187468 [Aspergillus filifer]
MSSGTPFPDPRLDQGSNTYVSVTIVTASFTFISTIIVALRLAYRAFTASLKWDDWVCLGALLFAYALLVTTILISTVGQAGHHIYEYDRHDLEKYIKILLANNIVYCTSIFLTKISILFFYHRLFFVNEALMRTSLIVGGITIAHWITSVVGFGIWLSPAHPQWKAEKLSTDEWVKPFWITVSALNMLLDFTILCMPQPIVWRLQQALRRKMMLSVLFAIGTFVCITTIVRVYYLSIIDYDDVTYTLSTVGIWTMLEMHLGIICACLPVIAGLVRFLSTRRRGKTPRTASDLSSAYENSRTPKKRTIRNYGDCWVDVRE